MPITPIKIKQYSATANQTGTAAPSLTIHQNDIGTIVWTRNSQGRYYGTLTGAFPEFKIRLEAHQTSAVDRQALLSRIDDDTILLIQTPFISPWDPVDELANVEINIEIYNATPITIN